MDNSPQFGNSTIRKRLRNPSPFSLQGKPGPGEISVPKSPVLGLLKSNASPSEEDRLEIEQVLFTAYERAAVLEQKLETIQDNFVPENRGHTGRGASRNNPETSIQQLQSCFAQLQSFIHIHEQLLSLVRELPNELLALVFTFCMPSIARHQWSRRPWKHGPTFRLSQVCRRWRAIAHTTPQLWSVIGDVNLNQSTAVLSTTLFNRGSSYKYYNFLEDVLHLSQREPLWVYVYAPLQEYERHEHPIIDLLAKHSGRWEVLTIESTCTTVNSICAAQRAFHPSPSAPFFPRLRKLGLALWGYPQGTVLDGFAVAPSLQELSVVGIQPHELRVPWDQLLVYRENPIGTTTWRGNLAAVLDKAKDLERMEVLNLGYSLALTTNGVTSTQWDLGRLKALHLKFSVKNYAEALLDGITAPSLEEIQIAAHPFYITPKLVAFIERSFLSQHKSELKKLLVCCKTMRSGDLNKVLKLTPNLEELNINFPPLLDLQGLIAGGRTCCVSAHCPQLVPNLKNLTLWTDLRHIKGNETTLQALGRARSRHSWTRGANGEYSTPDEQAMEKFRLVFYNRETALAAQSLLNFWMPNRHNSTNWDTTNVQETGSDAVLLKGYHSKLHEELPELDDSDMHPPRKRNFDLMFPVRLHKLLSSIKEFDFELEGRLRLACLYVSKLHLSLLELSRIRDSENRIPYDKKYQFRARAKNLLRKWEPYIKADLSSPQTTAMWALKGDRSLIYIPEDHPFRASAEVTQMVYGMEDELREVDLDWSNHM